MVVGKRAAFSGGGALAAYYPAFQHLYLRDLTT